MAFNTMNNGYAEQQSSINWGKVGLYGGGGLVLGGAARMGWRSMKGSKAGGWARDQAKGGWAKAGGWKGIQGFGRQALGGVHTAAGRSSQYNQGRGMMARAGDRTWEKGMNLFSKTGGKQGQDMMDFASNNMMGSKVKGKGIMAGAKKAGYGAMSFFGASGFSGAKRAGIAGARAGMLGAGIAAADFLNPFSLGWND